MYRKFSLLIALAASLALVACEDAPNPVASLSIAPAQIGLVFPHYQTIDLEIDMEAPLDAGTTPWVMLHLLDASGSVVRTFDHRLPIDWTPGVGHEYNVDLYQSALAPPLDPGVYRLTAGLYDPTAGRWPLTVEGEELHRMEYALASVEVPDGSGNAPKFFFSPTWMATEAGTDVQILGRRWLRSAGAIRVASVKAAGTVRLDLRIEAPDAQLEDLVLDEGFEEVLLDVTTTCSDQTWSLTGYDTHVLEVDVAPVAADAAGEADSGEASDGCEVNLTPHYRIVTRRNLNAKALALDLLAWRPAT